MKDSQKPFYFIRITSNTDFSPKIALLWQFFSNLVHLNCLLMGISGVVTNVTLLIYLFHFYLSYVC